jgi:hypothetical protein
VADGKAESWFILSLFRSHCDCQENWQGFPGSGAGEVLLLAEERQEQVYQFRRRPLWLSMVPSEMLRQRRLQTIAGLTYVTEQGHNIMTHCDASQCVT